MKGITEGMVSRMIIGFISKEDPFHDKMAWSGTLYNLRKAIEQAGYGVIWIPYDKRWLSILYTYLFKILNKILFRKHRWLGGCHFAPLAKSYGKGVAKNNKIRECDFLFFPGGAQIAQFIPNHKPVIFLSDATAHILIDYYHKNIGRKSRAMALDLEYKATKGANINIRSSKWAIDSVINDCDGAPDHCHVLEFGPNIDSKDIIQSQLYDGGELRVLFLGKNWDRKVGDIAVKTVEQLRDKGLEVTLSIVGPYKEPPSCVGKSYIRFQGCLDKNNSEDYQRIIGLYSQSHIFLLPTKAECSAVVFSEAAAAGLPVYTYITGGIGNYVVEGVNGHTLPLGSSAEMFAEQIYNDIKTHQLKSLREGALKLSKERLSWEVWSKKFKQILDEYVRKKDYNS